MILAEKQKERPSGWFARLCSGHLASCVLRGLARTIEIDVRSLAVFRVLLGLAVLLNLKDRFSEIPMHLSDDGWLPRTVNRRRLQRLCLRVHVHVHVHVCEHQSENKLSV